MDIGARAFSIPDRPDVHDRASNVLLPRKNDQPIANRDRLIRNCIGETDIVARDDFDGQLAVRANSDPRRKGRETDLEHPAHGKRQFGLRGHLKPPAQHQRLSMRRRSDLAALWCTGGTAKLGPELEDLGTTGGIGAADAQRLN
jgi:hypothetical protein